MDQNNKKTVLNLNLIRDGKICWQTQADIHIWMCQHDVPHCYHHTFIRGQVQLSAEFDNEEDAVLFKLTWADYVRQ
jgi:hypothetical protein